MSYLFPSRTITIEAALRDLSGGSPKARAMAAHALGDIRDPVEKRRAVEALMTALDDNRGEVRAEACGSLGTLGDPSALALLIKKLDDGVPEVRQNAAIALGTLRAPEAFTPLADALKSGPPDLRYQAATSLAEIDAVRAYGPLLAALSDADPQVVAAAALSLGAIGDPRAIDMLVPLLEHKDAGARFDAAYALAELRDPRARELLVKATSDEERAWDAVTALAWLDAKAELAAAVTGKKTPAEAQVLAAGHMLRLAADDADAREALVSALGSRKGHVRALAVEQLGLYAGGWARPLLEKLARSGKGADLGDPIASALRTITSREESK